MLQTSYFSSKAPRAQKVAIAKYPPRFWSGPRAPRLAPSNPKAEDWAAAYLRDLEERFPEGAGLAEYLAQIEDQTPGAILCCYEADPQQCHRRILAAYIEKFLGLTVPEWRPREIEQGNLL